MKKQDLDIDKAMTLAVDMQKLGSAQDNLTRVVSETLFSLIDYGELDETELELVRAAALPSYQQFLKKYSDRL